MSRLQPSGESTPWSEMPNYPPHAVAAPYLAVRLAQPLAAWRAVALPILMFLCWGGFRTLLQFSLVTLVFGLLAMKLADRRPPGVASARVWH